MILGIDEVGRGPWAGPLVIGAVVLGDAQIEGLTDSKKLTKKRREELDFLIREHVAGYALGWVSAAEIDEIGLSASLRLATVRAVEQITAPYHEIIIDGTINFLAETTKGKYVTTLKKADLLVPSVSAASIIAKVARDTYMAEQDEVYPGYKFASHVGYGTAVHRAAIERLGVTPLHRLSFAPLQKYGGRRASDSTFGYEGKVTTVSEEKQGLIRRTAVRLASLSPAKLTEVQIFSARQDATHTADGNRTNASASDTVVTTKQIGDRAEEAVANYLVREGHDILARNWKTKFCEIDIVSKKDDTVYFTEVKYRKNANQGGGFAAVTPKKQRQMKFAAEYYALKHEWKGAMRLAVASVTGEMFRIEEWMRI